MHRPRSTSNPAANAHDDAFIADDMPCAMCGYNLKTQRRGGRCPECGAEIPRSRAKRTVVDMLNPDDAAERRRLELGFKGMSIALLVMGGVRLLMLAPIPDRDALGKVDLRIADVAAVCAGLLWSVGVLLVTPSRFGEMTSMHAKLRWMIRILAWALPMAFVATLLIDFELLSRANAETGNGVWIVGRAAGGVGVLLVLIAFVEPALVADRDDVADALRKSFWGLLFTSLLVGWLPRGISLPAGDEPGGFLWVVYGMYSVFIVIWAIFMWIASTALWRLGVTAGWTTWAIRRSAGRDERIRVRRASMDEAVGSRIRPLR